MSYFNRVFDRFFVFIVIVEIYVRQLLAEKERPSKLDVEVGVLLVKATFLANVARKTAVGVIPELLEVSGDIVESAR